MPERVAKLHAIREVAFKHAAHFRLQSASRPTHSILGGRPGRAACHTEMCQNLVCRVSGSQLFLICMCASSGMLGWQDLGKDSGAAETRTCRQSSPEFLS